MNKTHEGLAAWLVEQSEARGWSWNEASRRAGLANNALSDIVNQRRGVGLKTCRGFAKAFNVPVEKMLELAGIQEQAATPEGRVIPELAGLYREAAHWPSDYQKILSRAWSADLEAVGITAGLVRPESGHTKRLSTPDGGIDAQIVDVLELARVLLDHLGERAYRIVIDAYLVKMRDRGFSEQDIQAIDHLASEVLQGD